MTSDRYIYKVIGGLISLISIYWLLKAGYHVIFYKSTGGLEKGVFGYPKEFWEVLVVFIFWIILLLGGLGIVKTNKSGLLIGLISLILSGLISVVYTIFLSSHRLKYSAYLTVGGVEREMTLSEKWEAIYFEPFKYILISIFIVIIFVMILKKMRLINGD